jgi:hypothetical protein
LGGREKGADVTTSFDRRRMIIDGRTASQATAGGILVDSIAAQLEEAKQQRLYRIEEQQSRKGGKGYRRQQFELARARYCPDDNTPEHTNKIRLLKSSQTDTPGHRLRIVHVSRARRRRIFGYSFHEALSQSLGLIIRERRFKTEVC